MSKIVSAVNAMISNANKISDVKPGMYPSQLYFVYNFLYIWSMSYDIDTDDYCLCYYPNQNNIDDLINACNCGEESFVKYRTNELKTREAIESFSELYTVLKEKVYNVDSVLDDIIDDMQT